MTKEFVAVLRFGSTNAMALIDKFWNICPENIWHKRAGGWPVGQQFYHLLSSSIFFLDSVKPEPVANPDPKGGHLKDDRDYCPSKADARKLYDSFAVALNNVLEALNDADLLKKNEGVSKMFGRDINNAQVLNLMVSHMLYHLGSCDAALRNEGLVGAF